METGEIANRKGNNRIQWPGGCEFAFTIYDDPDGQEYETTRLVYSFLAELGFRTTIAVWPVAPSRETNSGGQTCADPQYREFLLSLQERGFEIAFHHATPHTSNREETIQALNVFEEYFGAAPTSMANHYNAEALYWGTARLTGWRRTAYNLITRGRNDKKFSGHVDGDPLFWGDICRERIKYCRNFVFADINTLKMCPWMPYADPLRPYGRYWFAASEGDMAPSFLKNVQDVHQDRLQEQGGGSIMYTHFGHGYVKDGKLNPEFRRVMERLAHKKGWFVPASTMLDFLMKRNGPTELNGAQRSHLEGRWLWEKLFRGTS